MEWPRADQFSRQELERGALQASRDRLDALVGNTGLSAEDEERAFRLLGLIATDMGDPLDAATYRASCIAVDDYLWSPRCAFDQAVQDVKQDEVDLALGRFFELFKSRNATVNLDRRIQVNRLLASGQLVVASSGRVQAPPRSP